MSDEIVEQAPRAPLEFRFAETLDVRLPERIITVLAAPYEIETARAAKDGRMIFETFSRGTFDGIERRSNRVTVNRDHDLARTVGRAVAFHPARDEGLISDLRISRTPLGDETLELAIDGALGASVGFAALPDGEQWSQHRTRRRLTRAWLGHIAMVADPAYEGTQVLAVRAAAEDPATSATPLKDEILARLAEIGYRPPSK